VTDQPTDPPSYDAPPERLDGPGGIVLRRYADGDLQVLVDTVNANLEHLRPWMPWAAEPASMQVQGSWLRRSRQEWVAGREFGYGIFAADGTLVGGIGLHARNGPGVLEIGYWLAADAVGQGIATAAAQVLTDAAAGIAGVDRVEIRCDEGNTRSAAVPQRLGYTLIGVERRPPAAAAESFRHQILSVDVSAPTTSEGPRP
jgi:RimJ/RimL family protein N-acetyltransferase